jgi:hypothetical protein
MISCCIVTDSTGYLPAALSAESITVREGGRGCEELRGVGEASVERDDLIRSASIECTHLRLLSHRWL